MVFKTLLTVSAEADRYYNFSYEALEEALANAVYHKSYELANPIEVQIWPERIEILSFPGPIPPVNAKILAENKRIVARDYRNRRVGDFLKELHLTEGRGTGIPTMKRVLTKTTLWFLVSVRLQLMRLKSKAKYFSPLTLCSLPLVGIASRPVLFFKVFPTKKALLYSKALLRTQGRASRIPLVSGGSIPN